MKVLPEYVTELPDGQTKLFTKNFHHMTWTNLIKKAGVPPITFHQLRTCTSSWLKKAGISDGVVTALFGHSEPSVTTRHYTQLDDIETKRAAIEKLPLYPSTTPAKPKRHSQDTES